MAQFFGNEAIEKNPETGTGGERVGTGTRVRLRVVRLAALGGYRMPPRISGYASRSGFTMDGEENEP